MTLALALAGSPAAGASTSARPAVLCSSLTFDQQWDLVHDRTVDGDLVVDASCTTAGVYITGDVVVLPDALAVHLHGSTVLGDVRSADGPATWPTVSMSGTTVYGDVELGEGAWLDTSTVHGDVLVATGDEPGGFEGAEWTVTLERMRVRGDVRGATGDLTLVSSAVLGSVDVTSTVVTRVRDSLVHTDLTARGGRLVVHDSSLHGSVTAAATQDVLVCRTGVGGDLTVRGVRLWSRVGEERTEYCRTTVGGSVHVLDNPSSVILGDLHVTGDLTCARNTGRLGVVQHETLVVAGTRSPACD
ncbi:hypothetical protein [Cellulomonas sp. NS3]|uniref:hypothetical protein n=1 Tax=Cellulomonas sp. NS3 TaxID=2973977 RepID=UPI002162F62C|nr:hypothetical protein [Cellulomonas sp. NS3]